MNKKSANNNFIDKINRLIDFDFIHFLVIILDPQPYILNFCLKIKYKYNNYKQTIVMNLISSLQ
jgi:hypothetical protein